jgi:hypothetical protein
MLPGASLNTLEAFYRGLAYDDAFRKRLIEDPKATLKQLGIELPIGEIERIALPTKEAVVGGAAKCNLWSRIYDSCTGDARLGLVGGMGGFCVAALAVIG